MTKRSMLLVALAFATVGLLAQTSQAGGGAGQKKTQEKGVVHRDLASREAATGKASGITAPRDHASGQATGKRVATGHVDGDGSADIKLPHEHGTGVATGKRQQTPATTQGKAPSAGKEKPKMSGANSNPLYDDKGGSGTSPLHQKKD